MITNTQKKKKEQKEKDIQIATATLIELAVGGGGGISGMKCETLRESDFFSIHDDILLTWSLLSLDSRQL